jgi:hypothetical protein
MFGRYLCNYSVYLGMLNVSVDFCLVFGIYYDQK